MKKNYAEVLIDGKIYTLGGSEDTSYFQKVAAYVNQKLGELRSHPGFLKQKEDYQLVMLEINMADDYFKAQESAERLELQKTEMDRDVYGLKHELINTQMKLEEAQNRIAELEAAVKEAKTAASRAKREAAAALLEAEEKPEPAPAPEAPALTEEERRLREEEEKKKALQAARAATEQLFKGRPMPNRNH
ncbi:MAG: cell division protein ZapA [Lachnospiraceae bacterium]|nr:cell division protein ZapA [Lachnospiraceae bacterium]